MSDANMMCVHSIKHCNVLTVTRLFGWVSQITPHPHCRDKADKLRVEQDVSVNLFTQTLDKTALFLHLHVNM